MLCVQKKMIRAAAFALCLGLSHSATSSSSLRGRSLQDYEMIDPDEANRLDAAEQAQRVEEEAKLAAALQTQETAKAEAETAQANLYEPTPERMQLETTEGGGDDLQATAADAEALVEKLKSTLAEEEELLASLTAKLDQLTATTTTTNAVEGGGEEGGAGSPVVSSPSAAGSLKAATWNMAAINNNPFEYWVTYEGDGGQAYYDLMDKISEFLSDPGDGDVAVSTIFTDDMFRELSSMMMQGSVATDEELETVKNEYWDSDYAQRKIVQDILKDPVLGAKRLVSMPDRVTNTVQLADGSTAMRPTVINCYGGDLPDMATWWVKWQEFMFAQPLKTSETEEAKTPIQMLPKILKVKYPTIEEEEEALSIPLSATLLAIFDATLVHIVNQASTEWQGIRKAMCSALNERKNDRTAEILETLNYNDLDVVFLQESSMTFARVAESRDLGTNFYDFYAPTKIDPSRDQNSLILLKKGEWTEVVDSTDEVMQLLIDQNGGKSPAAIGDLNVHKATRDDGKKYLLASFHGDTNGLATVPVVTAVHDYAVSLGEERSLLFGLDANTHFECEDDEGKKFRACVTDFAASFKSQDIDSVYGSSTDVADYEYTTFNARTYLQPQLNKAVKESEKKTSKLVDKNPKDFILFWAKDFSVSDVQKDNTGEGSFTQDIVFPTLTFPSDHAITKAALLPTAAATQADSAFQPV